MARDWSDSSSDISQDCPLHWLDGEARPDSDENEKDKEVGNKDTRENKSKRERRRVRRGRGGRRRRDQRRRSGDGFQCFWRDRRCEEVQQRGCWGHDGCWGTRGWSLMEGCGSTSWVEDGVSGLESTQVKECKERKNSPYWISRGPEESAFSQHLRICRRR